MKSIKFTSNQGIGQLLHCPNCNGNYLHLQYVDSYFRSNEDNQIGTHVKVSGHNDIELDDNMYGNPCSRRNGVTMSFTCEACNTNSFLSLANVKGETHMGWFNGLEVTL